MTTEYSGSGDPVRSMELLWGEAVGAPPGDRARRGPKPRLSVGAIAAAAIALADAEGLAALSMRRVAERLGVTAMSLYTYVPGKAELVDVMLDTVLGELPRPPVDGGWRERLAQVAHANWELYRRHPWMLQVAVSRPVLGPNMLAKYDYELRALDGVGVSEVEQDLLLSLVCNYVLGAVRGVLDAAAVERATGVSELDWWAAYEPLLTKVFDPQRYPTAARVGAAAGEEYQAAYDPVRAFEFGLDRVLDGIGAFITTRGAR